MRRAEAEIAQLGLFGLSELSAGTDHGLKDVIRDKLSGRPGSKRQEYEHMRNQASNETNHNTVAYERGISLASRAALAKRDLGFLPYSSVEMTLSLGFRQELGVPKLDTVKYLNDVLRRQSKENVEIDHPARTPMHIVLDASGFAADALYTQMFTQRFMDETYGANPELRVAEVDEADQHWLRLLVRHQQISQLASNANDRCDTFEDTNGELDLDYILGDLKGPVGVLLTEFAEGTTLKQARDIGAALIDEQQIRHDFWNERTERANGHFPSRPMVTRVLGLDEPRVY